MCVCVQTPGCKEGQWDDCSVSYATFNIQWASQIQVRAAKRVPSENLHPASQSDHKPARRLQGFLELGGTTFTILILLLGAIIFIRDTDRLVLQPLERMVHLVGRLLQ